MAFRQTLEWLDKLVTLPKQQGDDEAKDQDFAAEVVSSPTSLFFFV
jgi:hypothetical protein